MLHEYELKIMVKFRCVCPVTGSHLAALKILFPVLTIIINQHLLIIIAAGPKRGPPTNIKTPSAFRLTGFSIGLQANPLIRKN